MKSLDSAPSCEIKSYGEIHYKSYRGQHNETAFHRRKNGYQLHLADVNKQAEDMFFRLVKQMAERDGVTEQLKADNQMEWVARMNNIRSRATEIVNYDIIYN